MQTFREKQNAIGIGLENSTISTMYDSCIKKCPLKEKYRNAKDYRNKSIKAKCDCCTKKLPDHSTNWFIVFRFQLIYNWNSTECQPLAHLYELPRLESCLNCTNSRLICRTSYHLPKGPSPRWSTAYKHRDQDDGATFIPSSRSVVLID